VNTASTLLATLPRREFRIFDIKFIRLSLFSLLAVIAVALILLPAVVDRRYASRYMTGFTSDSVLEKQEKNAASFADALSSKPRVAWRARSMEGAGPFWELRVEKYGDLVSVRNGARTILKMPKLQKADERNRFGASVLIGKGENFAIEIIPEPCGDSANGYEGSGKVWITFKDPARQPLFGCAFLQRQSHDYSTEFYPISYN
jgi:hypothetical protein